MAKINPLHVVGSGILAGALINILGSVAWANILGNEYVSHLGAQSTGRTNPGSMGWIVLIGILSIWLYVALRPHFRWSPATAALAGSVTWTLCYALPSYAMWAFGIVSGPLVVVTLGVALAQMLVATLAGAACYDLVADSVPDRKPASGDPVRTVPLSRAAEESPTNSMFPNHAAGRTPTPVNALRLS
jgi:hypothetical protein